MPHFVATLVRHLRSRLVDISAFPQVAFAVAHSTSQLSKVLPLQGNSTSSNKVAVTYVAPFIQFTPLGYYSNLCATRS